MPPLPLSRPETSTDEIIPSLFRSIFERAVQQSAHWDSLALFTFARQIAEHFGLSAAAVLDEIERTPPHILAHAREPQGLTAVAFYLAGALGATNAPALIPTIH